MKSKFDDYWSDVHREIRELYIRVNQQKPQESTSTTTTMANTVVSEIASRLAEKYPHIDKEEIKGDLGIFFKGYVNGICDKPELSVSLNKKKWYQFWK
jgi:hypothetical protein